MAEEVSGSRLLKAVEAIAISPADAKLLVDSYRARCKAKYPDDGSERHRARIAQLIVGRYAKLAGTVGGLSGLIGLVPGLGTVLAAVGGATADAAACMKYQVDMCRCLAYAYGYDLTTEDARHLALLIAAGGTLEKAGVGGGTKIATQAGVRLLRQYLKGAALQAVKAFFKKLGIIFTRKALEKALPFGIGVVLGSSANYALTRYVGRQAARWFALDAQMDG